ncbi:hypothetical protein BIW11_07881, partial [Tropilaelaps mercedesae]
MSDDSTLFEENETEVDPESHALVSVLRDTSPSGSEGSSLEDESPKNLRALNKKPAFSHLRVPPRFYLGQLDESDLQSVPRTKDSVTLADETKGEPEDELILKNVNIDYDRAYYEQTFAPL